MKLKRGADANVLNNNGEPAYDTYFGNSDFIEPTPSVEETTHRMEALAFTFVDKSEIWNSAVPASPYLPQKKTLSGIVGNQSEPASPQAERSEVVDDEAADSDGAKIVLEEELSRQNLYKTELCRSFVETGICRYGHKCQFAHGSHEIRPVMRHPKYKTEVCKKFASTGHCPYGVRCRFIHPVVSTPMAPVIAPPTSAQVNPNHSQVVWSNSWATPTNNAPVVLEKKTIKKALPDPIGTPVAVPASGPAYGENQTSARRLAFFQSIA